MDETRIVIRSEHHVLNKSLLISNLQKCVRRKETDKALVTAAVLIEHFPLPFARRLPIIVLEDTILHPNFPSLIDLMIKVSHKAELSVTDAELFLGVVRDICEVPVRDKITEVGLPQVLSHSQKAQEILGSIGHRTSFGGMTGDMKMLMYYQQLWSSRFHEPDETWWNYLDDLFSEREPIQLKDIPVLRKEDVLTAAVDFHCSPLTNILAKKPEVIELVQREFTGRETKPVLDGAVWYFRSAINDRKVFWDESFPTDPSYELDDEERLAFKRVYQTIEEGVESISDWWIKKCHEQKEGGGT